MTDPEQQHKAAISAYSYLSTLAENRHQSFYELVDELIEIGKNNQCIHATIAKVEWEKVLERFENDKSLYTGEHIHRVLKYFQVLQEK